MTVDEINENDNKNQTVKYNDTKAKNSNAVTNKKALEPSENKTMRTEAEQIENDGKPWKESFEINPNLDEYGDMKAKIIDIGVFDEFGNVTTTILKGTNFTLRSKTEFLEDIKEPIFTYTLKTIKGQDITGTNTMYEKKEVELAKQGDVYVVSFSQNMNLQGGEYLLSMSCTSFENGELVAHDRLYDVLNISVVSDKNTVGFYDMNSKVSIKKVR